MFHLETPLFLLAIFLIPLFFLIENKRKRGFLFYPSLKLLESESSSKEKLFHYLPIVLKCLALAFCIFALARPQLANVKTEVSSEGVDILLTIDTSGSMKALDFKVEGEEVDRLVAVKKVVKDFIKNRVSDRIGMVVFGDMAYTQTPLTLDYEVLLNFLNQVEIGAAGDATAIGDGIALSVKRLKDLPGKSKVIILLTDGRSNAGRITPDKAAEIAAEYGVKIYTIGVGSRGPVPFPEQTFFGIRHILVQLDMDEETLQRIAEKTKGQYFRATDTEALKKIYETIDQLEKVEAKVTHYQEYQELYRYFLVIALVLMLSEMFLRLTWFRSFP